MSRYKQETVASTVADAVGTMYDDLEGLQEEIQEVVDNAVAETGRIETLSETADLLSGIDRADEPDSDLGALVVMVPVTYRTGKKRGLGESRAIRCSNAASHGTAAAEAIRAFCDEHEEKDPNGGAEGEEATEDADEEWAAKIAEYRELADKLEEDASSVEEAEFPPMMG